MKYLTILFFAISAALVSGCKDQNTVNSYSQSVCIDGVKYHTYFSGYRGAMAVAIDSETLKPIKCYGGVN